MQRLFSTFPDGSPGRGLLLLRIASAVPLFVTAVALSTDVDAGTSMPLRAAGAVDGIFLLLGLGTPFATTLQVLIEAWLAFASGPFNPNHGARAVMGLALIMLGPGQYSIDGRLYGRKRIELKR